LGFGVWVLGFGGLGGGVWGVCFGFGGWGFGVSSYRPPPAAPAALGSLATPPMPWD